ncbi:hypothetical protein DPMN_026483 [Dreissena polymorpha]|uniref:Uncharacterized protein n=1 Tax=Dreissena polymorpha TaxID=45954 RepID=A0A9D4LTI1_DREPO|nr:hypothetical protein DPMN_026483 [Dreissena polymorpha]
MCAILQHHATNVVYVQTLPTFLPYAGYCDNDGQGLISVTLAAYKQAFHPAPVDPNKFVLTLLLDIFTDICRCKSRWKQVQEAVADSVYVISSAVADGIRKCEDRNAFFSVG